MNAAMKTFEGSFLSDESKVVDGALDGVKNLLVRLRPDGWRPGVADPAGHTVRAIAGPLALPRARWQQGTEQFMVP
jgi:hypothetical protein